MKKGFTLIELLAVIVILAIIALIATPIVLDIIEDSKESAAKRSIENYIHASELSISQRDLKGNNLIDGYYNIETLDIQVDGEIPEYGYIEISNGEIVNYNLNLNGKNYIKTENGVEETKNDPMKTAAELSIDYLNNSIIKGISMSYSDTLSLNFYIDKAQVNNKNVYLKSTNTTRIYSSSQVIETFDNLRETDKYFILSYKNLIPGEFTNEILFQIIDENEVILDSITYSAINYIKNKIYSTNNQFENNILISLTNLDTAVQYYMGYNTSNISTSILNDEDINYTELTEEAQVLKDNPVQLDESILNCDDETIKLGKAIDPGSSNYLRFSISKDGTKLSSSSVSQSEFEKYGILVFDDELFNSINDRTDNYSKLNVDTIGVNIVNGDYELSNFRYFINFKDLYKTFYIRVYYKNEDGNYVYDNLMTSGFIEYCSNKVTDDTTDSFSNFCKSLLNVISLLD